MTKENPVNPDPLYPRNRGYRFEGYQLDAEGVPTFLYRTGMVSVSDRSQVVVSDELNSLVRALHLDAPKSETVNVRVLTGKVQRLAPRQYGTESLKVWLPETEVLLRGAGETKELLMKLNLPEGKSEWGIRYELLR